jgi:protein-S-isoprenylcysteine O-methyltransferase Ste14
MSLVHSLEKSGNFLFRYRGQMPLILFAMAIPAIYFAPKFNNEIAYSVTNIYGFIAISLTVFGFLIRVVTVGTSKKFTSGRNTKAGQVANELNTTGMYSIVRNPLYLGNFFMWIGIVVYTQNWWFVAIVSVMFFIYYALIIFAEEQFLTQKFGSEYLEWKMQVPSLFPVIWKYKKSNVSFSIKSILRREYGAVSAAIISFLFVDLVREIIYTQTLSFNSILTYYLPLTLFALLFSFTLRRLKHKTKLLNEDDRW